MPMATPPPTLYSDEHLFADFDQLASQASQWDLELSQLDRGDFRGRLFQFGVGDVHLSEARFGRSLVQQGNPPVGLRTIAIPANRHVRFSWRGHSIDGEQLLVFPRGAELHSVSNPDFHVFTCSISEELLGLASESLGIGALDALAGDTGVVRCNASSAESLQRTLRELSGAARHPPSGLSRDECIRFASDAIPRKLLDALATTADSDRAATFNRRTRALILAETFIRQFASEEISVRDIATAAHVSQRTLEYAFAEHYHLTPKAFLKAYRLGALRRVLRVSDANRDKVASLASHWGFWHMGQLAADYRKQFGELPSQTLRRNRD